MHLQILRDTEVRLSTATTEMLCADFCRPTFQQVNNTPPNRRLWERYRSSLRIPVMIKLTPSIYEC